MWSNHSVGAPDADDGVALSPAPETTAPTSPHGETVPAPRQVDVSPHSSSLALHEGSFDIPSTLMERIELCRFLAEANLLPSALRQQPANILLIMHKALALDIPLSIAVEHMHVIDGKVGHSAELLRTLLRRHGHMLRWVTLTDKEVVGEVVLRHDPKNPRRETFTLADAQRMKLVNKDNWQKDPTSMLVARCTKRLVSRHCPEVAVALGNLSASDVDDDPILPAEDVPQESVPSVPSEPQDELPLQDQASSLIGELAEASTSVEVKEVGHKARQADLLDHVVDGDRTLQQVILAKLAEVNGSTADKPRARRATAK